MTNEMKGYWDEKISWWAESSYEEQPRGALDRFMARLRRSVHARAVIALELLKPHIEGKTILDIGCGNGHFVKGCVELGAKHAYGIDISPEAIKLARRLAEKNGYADRSTFSVGRAGDSDLPQTDFVTGFGLIDWLSGAECMTMLRNIEGRKFVFSYSEQDGSFDEWIHHFYLIERLRWFGGGVRAYHHPREVIVRRFRKAGHGPVEVVERREMRFGRLIHNLEK
jgi:predicted RNA methylase